MRKSTGWRVKFGLILFSNIKPVGTSYLIIESKIQFEYVRHPESLKPSPSCSVTDGLEDITTHISSIWLDVVMTAKIYSQSQPHLWLEYV